MRREPATRPENILALAAAEIERIKALLGRVTDGRNLVISTGTGASDTTLPVETGAHTLYGVKQTRSFRVTDGGGLNADYEQGQIWMGGAFYTPVAGTLGLDDNATNYVFVNHAGAVAYNATGFPTNCWPLAQVTTVAGDITALVDRRAYGAQIIGDAIILGNPLIVGDDDSARGRLTLYGDGIFTPDGGEVQFYLGAAHDGAFEYWIIQAYEDDLRIFRSDYGASPLTITAERTIQIYDANFILSVTAGNPRFTYDANDYSEYDRPTNAYSWYIGATEYMRLDATKLDLMNAVYMDANDVELPHLGAATYDTVEDANMVIHSAGWISGGNVTDAGGGNVDVSAGTGLIRAAATATSPLHLCDWGLSAGNAIPNNTIRYVGVEYNVGTPQVTIHNALDWDHYTDFGLAVVVNEGGVLHIMQGHRLIVGDHISLMNQRMHQTDHISRDDLTGGSMFSEGGVRYVIVSPGAFWVGLTRIAIGPFDTTVPPGVDTFDAYSSAGLEAPPARSQWPNTDYDNGGVLTPMNNNWWANLWWYLCMANHLVMVYGTAQYATEAQAEAELPPTVLPDRVAEHGVLAARFIFQKSAPVTSQILSPFVVPFQAAGVTLHANLAGIGGGEDDHPEYLLADGTRNLTGDLLVTVANEIQFRDTDLAIYSGGDGQLNLKADVAVGITTPIVSLPSGVLYVGSDDATVGQLVLYGDNANAGGFVDLYVGDGQDTNFNFWTFGIKSGSDDLEWTITTPAPATSARMLLTAQGQLQVDTVAELTATVGTTVENVTHRDGSIELHHGTDTIAGDEILAPTGGYIIAAAQAGVTDDLDGIGGGANGRIIAVRADAGDTITVRHNDAGGGAGRKIFLNHDAHLVLIGDDEDTVTLLYDESLDGASGAWFEIGRSSTDQPTCRVSKNAAQAIGTGVTTLVTWEATDFDNDGMADLVNERIVIQTPGKYLVVGVVNWSNGNGLGGANLVRLGVIRINVVGTALGQVVSPPVVAAGVGTIGNVVAIYDFSAADYIDFYAYHDAGANLNINGGGGVPARCSLSATRIAD